MQTKVETIVYRGIKFRRYPKIKRNNSYFTPNSSYIKKGVRNLHRYKYKCEVGEIPIGYDIHHKDFNKKNYKLDNLSLETYSDHRKIHAGWVRENGNWTLKPCKDCKQLLPLDKFYQRKGLTPNQRCIKCLSIYSKVKLKNNPEYRERKRLYLKGYYKDNKKEILRKQREKYANS